MLALLTAPAAKSSPTHIRHENGGAASLEARALAPQPPCVLIPQIAALSHLGGHQAVGSLDVRVRVCLESGVLVARGSSEVSAAGRQHR